MHCNAKHVISLLPSQGVFAAGPSEKNAKIRLSMKKDTQFTFRIPSQLKSQLEAIAATEGRSVAQVCEAFLRAGSEAYKKKGSGFLQQFLSRAKSSSSS